MALYTLVDGVPEKVWPDLGVATIGQGLTFDNTLATARVTAQVPMSIMITATVGFENIPLTGGANTLLLLALRSFTVGDVEKSGRAGSSMFIDRDTGEVALNVSMIEVLDVGEYFDLICESIGETLVDAEILTALQFWILDR